MKFQRGTVYSTRNMYLLIICPARLLEGEEVIVSAEEEGEVKIIFTEL